MAQKFIYKRFNIAITQANISYSKKFDLDGIITLVRGLQMTTDKPEMLYYRGSQKIEINGKEVFPEDYESKLLMSGISVAPDQRFIILGEGIEPGNREVKILYKDASQDEFLPYQVSLILKCDIRE